MNQTKVLQQLGLATRARKVVFGEEFVLQGMAKQHASLVFLAIDAGDNIRKKIYDKATSFDAQVIESFTTSELSNAVGKEGRKVLLIQDRGFIELIQKTVNS